jgi:RNA polymerase II subunit A small phosphatase-like protein
MILQLQNSFSSYTIVQFQVPVQSWFDDMEDTELRDLIPFFEALAKVDNVYTFLRNAQNTDSS